MAARGPYNIAVLGAGGVGKSCLALQFARGLFMEEYDPTIEDTFQKECTIDGVSCTLNILDTAGQSNYEPINDAVHRYDGHLLVYAVDNRDSLAEVRHRHAKILRLKNLAAAPMVLIANKCDVPVRRVTTQEGELLAVELGIAYHEVSAKERVNVDLVFEEVVRRIREHERGAEKTEKKEKAGKVSCRVA